MINFEIIFQLVFWILLALLFLDAIVITKNESGRVGKAWGVAILGAILLFIINSIADWLSNNSIATFFIILLIYIPATNFFARKYAVVRGFFIVTALREREELADPLDFSEIFLSMLALLVLCFANSAQEIGEALLVFSIMSIGTFLGVYRFENKKYISWKENFRLLLVKPDKDKEESKKEDQKNQTKKYSYDLEDFLYFTLPVGLSYFGLPLLLFFSLYRLSPWIWGGFILFLVGFISPHLFFLFKRNSFHRNVTNELKMLKHAEDSKDLQFVIDSLKNSFMKENARGVLGRWVESDSYQFSELYQMLKDGKGNDELLQFLWDVTKGKVKEYLQEIDSKLNLNFLDQHFDFILDKSMPITLRTRILYLIVNTHYHVYQSNPFEKFDIFRGHLNEILADKELLQNLKDSYDYTLSAKKA